MGKQAIRFTNMSDSKLIGEAMALYDSIYVTECYSVKDMIYLDAITAELEKRGYTAVEDKKLTFKQKRKVKHGKAKS